MAVDWEASFREALVEVMRSWHMRVKDVIAWEEKRKSDGYCDTCYFEYTEVDITYIDTDDQVQLYSWSGDFGELMRAMSAV